MELKDTVYFMTSTDKKNQMKAEYYQLSIRIDETKRILDALRKNNVDYHTIQARRLKSQYYFMTQYLRVLEKRAVSMGIKL